VSQVEILRSNILFAALNEQQFSRVLSGSRKIQLKEGELLFQQQQQASFFYCLQIGSIKLFRLSVDGAEKVIEIIAPGQTFAEAVMFMSGHAYPVNAQALSHSELIQVDMNVFRKILAESPQTCLNILGKMSQKLHGMVQEIEQLTVQNAKMRLIQFLLRMIPPESEVPYSIRWNTPKTVLASRLSIRPETFSRVLQQLSQEGMIKVDKKSITILDIHGLKTY